VALLSRYILVQGDNSVANSRVGPHIRVEGQARIRGVEVSQSASNIPKGRYMATLQRRYGGCKKCMLSGALPTLKVYQGWKHLRPRKYLGFGGEF